LREKIAFQLAKKGKATSNRICGSLTLWTLLWHEEW